MAGQVKNGKGFEWAMGTALEHVFHIKIVESSASLVCQDSFNQLSTEKQNHCMLNAEIAAYHLKEMEPQLASSTAVRFQEDNKGQTGDVRDLIIEYSGGELGISCKSNHSALKHSRLSDKIDFVRKWGLSENGCSPVYWDAIRPTFANLRELKSRGVLWSEMPIEEKKNVYWRVLDAFALELQSVVNSDEPDLGENLIKYLIGQQDYYKVISRPKQVEIFGFNFFKTLNLPKLQLPKQILAIDNKNGGQYSKTVRFSNGFTVNFRIHNAEKVVSPSLKFDIEALAWPEKLHRQIILKRQKATSRSSVVRI